MNVMPEVVNLFDYIMTFFNPIVSIGVKLLKFAGDNWALTAGLIIFYILLTTRQKLHTILCVAFLAIVAEILILEGIIPPIGVILQEVKNVVG